MSTTPANATFYPVYGQLYNLSGVIKSLTTGNPLTGGLTTLAAVVSKDDGAFTTTANAPVEIGTSGFFSLDLSVTEMTAHKLVVNVTASNTNAIYWSFEITDLLLSPFSGRADAQSVLRFEQNTLDLGILAGLNGSQTTGAEIQFYNPDGSLHFQASAIQGQVSGMRSKTA